MAQEPLDRVGVEVGRVHLDRRGQVQDQRALGRRVDHLDDGVADLQRVVEFGAGEALGRVLVEELGRGRRRLEGPTERGGVGGDLRDARACRGRRPRGAAASTSSCRSGRSRAWRPMQRLVGAADEVLAALGQHLDRHVLGDEVVLDDVAHEVEVGLGGRGEADLDLLEAHLDELGEHRVLALEVHRVDQGLVAVAQVHAAPARRLGPVGGWATCGRAGRRAPWPGTCRTPWGWAVGGTAPHVHPFRRGRGEKQKTPADAGVEGEQRLALRSSSSLVAECRCTRLMSYAFERRAVSRVARPLS